MSLPQVRICLISRMTERAREIIARLEEADVGPFVLDQATSPADAVERLSAIRHDLVALDLDDGADSKERMREVRAVRPHMAGIVLAERANPEIEAVALDLGFQDFIVWQEMLPRQIGERIRAALRRQRYVNEQLGLITSDGAWLPRMAAHHAKLGGWAVRLPDQIISWSDEMARIFGVPIGTPPDVEEAFQQFVPGYRELIRSAYETCAATGKPFSGEYQIQRPNGDLAWVHVIGEAITDEHGQIVRVQGSTQDITDLKNAQASLEASQRQFHELADSMPLIVWTSLPSGEIDYASQAFFEYAGVSRDTDLATRWQACLHPDDLERSVATWTECVENERNYDIEYRLRRGSDHQYRWFRVQARPVRDTSGKVVKWYGTATDVHDIRNLEQESTELARRLTTTLNSITDGFLMVDRDWRLTFLNPMAERILQRKQEEVLGRSLWDEFPDAVGSIFYEQYFKAVEEKVTVNFEGYYPALDLTVEVTAYPSSDGLAIVFVDIGERKRREEQLRILEACITRSNDVVLITEAEPIDAPGPRITYVNDAFERQTGYSREEVLGQTPRLLQGPGTDRSSLDRIRDALTHWQPIREELVNYRKNGEEFWNEIDISPVADETGWYTHWIAIERDITERKKNELELRVSQERFRLLARATTDAIYDWNLASGEVWWSEGYFELFGFLPEETPSNVESWTLHIHPDDQWVVEQVSKTIQDKGTIWTGEYRFRRRNGTYVWVWDRAFLIYGSDGEPIRMVGSMTDLTERKEAEQALLRSERLHRNLAEQLEAVLNASLDLICTLDEEGRFVHMNAACRQVLGYEPTDMIGRSIFEFILPEDHAKTLEEAERVKQGEPGRRFENRYRHADGSIVVLEWSIQWSEEDRLGYGVGRNVTQSRERERQIAEQARLIDEARDAILVRSLNHEILFWNRGAERLYGWSAEEVLGRSARDLIYDKKDECDKATEVLIREGEWKGELVQQTKDGSTVLVDGRWTLLEDEHGNPRAILAINSDITQRKKLEQQFLRAQRMESIGTLAGGIAHDLNNVLAPIILSVGLLRTNEADPMRLQVLDVIESSAKRGAEMIGQVLSFARGMDGQKVPVQLGSIVGDIAKIIRDTFPKSVQLELDVADDVWTLHADPTQIHQVLLNMCVNSRDAMPDGGTLRIAARNTHIDAHYATMNIDASEGPHVVIDVEDTGVGIPADIMEKIFEPFFSTKEVGKGTGLGLSTSLAIIKSHGGFIRVYSDPGNGTRFHVYLPAETDTKASGDFEGGEDLPRGNGELILVVDDESSVRQITKQTLEAFGYRVITAADGAEAVSIYAKQQEEIAVVVTDMMMPVMDGPATIRVLYRMNPQARIVAASGITGNGKVAQMASLGVQHFLPKPYTAQTILKVLRSVIDSPKG